MSNPRRRVLPTTRSGRAIKGNPLRLLRSRRPPLASSLAYLPVWGNGGRTGKGAAHLRPPTRRLPSWGRPAEQSPFVPRGQSHGAPASPALGPDTSSRTSPARDVCGVGGLGKNKNRRIRPHTNFPIFGSLVLGLLPQWGLAWSKPIAPTGPGTLSGFPAAPQAPARQRAHRIANLQAGPGSTRLQLTPKQGIQPWWDPAPKQRPGAQLPVSPLTLGGIK